MAKQQKLAAPALHWCAAAVVTTLLPHLPRLPLWESLAIFGLISIKILLLQSNRELPRWILAPLTLVLAAIVFFSFGTLVGRHAGISLLAIMLAMKFLEARLYRDGILLVFLAYFVVVTNFLFDQSIFIAIYLLFAVLVTTVALISLNQVGALPTPKQRSKLALRMVLEAVPVMLVLFILFPRISGPLWGIPEDQNTAQTGLSDSMSPGRISELTRNGSVAFRVKFVGQPPSYEQRYWRGPVLSNFDGNTWRQAEIRDLPTTQVRVFSDPIDYTLTLEPHNRKWIFGMDYVLRPPAGTELSSDFQLLSKKNRAAVSQYQLRSYPSAQFPADLTHQERLINLQLPQNSNPRTVATGKQLGAAINEPQQLVQRVLGFYRNEPFRYTLNPPLLGTNAMDEFLFETRAGFCEHYAGSFVIIMRAAGIPARVVTGYMGGELNEFDDYMIVRQSDAHAWAEVWLPNQGWTRVDPTAAIAPERIERGLESALPDNELLPFMARSGDGLLRRIGLTWDSINNGWNEWVLGYGPKLQQQFLNKLGFENFTAPKAIIIAIVLIGILLTTIVLTPNFIRKRYAKDPVLRAYQKFCRKLAKVGLEKANFEGPQFFAERVAQRVPKQASLIKLITKLYLKLHFGKEQNLEAIQQFRQLVKKFAINKRELNTLQG